MLGARPLAQAPMTTLAGLWYGFISQFLAVVAALLVLALYFSERVLGMSLIVKKLMNINHFLTLVMGLLLLGLGLAMVQDTEAEFNGAGGGFMLALGAAHSHVGVGAAGDGERLAV